MKRRLFLLTIAGAAAAAAATDAQQQVFDLFTKIAAGLSDDDPAIFVEAIDPDMPRAELTALAGEANLTNSIEIMSDTGDDTHRDEEVDWLLEIVTKSDSHTVERRHKAVKFRLERKGKKWKIVGIDPLDFFAPPKA
jgi:hypothetical protein